MALDINTAGTEFVKTVITLYRSATYYREKDILAQKLMDHVIEAGRLTDEVSLCPEYRESYFAQCALGELGKAMFILKVMCEDGIYPARKVQPVKDFAEQLKELLKLYVSGQPETVAEQPSEPLQLLAQPVVEEQEAVAEQEEQAALPAPSEQPQPEQQEAQPAAPEEKKQVQKVPVQDKGGFYEIYTGKI